MMKKIADLIKKMTLEEKAGLLSGLDQWHTKPVERLGVPSVMMTDGPHGMRKQAGQVDQLGLVKSVEAVCFPSASALACSFDRELMRTLGDALGEECRAEDVAILLGPAINIKRTPLCGRNFEYLSEDPYLTGELAAGYIQGLQAHDVGVSVKHFAANNQEYRRMSVNAEIDERTLREIYLAGFETAVKKAKPWTMMCSYNRINGAYSSENGRLMKDILRGEWNFDGFVMTDWGAINDRVRGVESGIDLEMPASGGMTDREIVAAVRSGALDISLVDQAAARILDIVCRYHDSDQKRAPYDRERHHALARKIAGECMVLLKNDGVLPLSSGMRAAFIGAFAERPRYQGGGSSHINAFRVTSALEAARGRAEITFAPGYDVMKDEADSALIAQAVEAARAAEVAVIFAGLPDRKESEGYDREDMRLPAGQNALIEAVCAVQPNTVVVLHTGSPVEMPWIDKVRGLLDVYLGGQAVGEATADVLFGDVNPSGKLAESFPQKLAHNPSYLNYPGEGDTAHYREGVFVGYRYYDKKEMDVLFPFGFGLSYTTFAYSNLKIAKDGESVHVSADVTNQGTRAGREVVQLYVGKKASAVSRPVRELREFAKIALEPGQTSTVSFTLDRRAFSYYEETIADWYVEGGTYEIALGASSRDLPLVATVEMTQSAVLPFRVTLDTVLSDIWAHGLKSEKLDRVMEKTGYLAISDSEDGLGESTARMMREVAGNSPLHALRSPARGTLTMQELSELADELNAILAARGEEKGE